MHFSKCGPKISQMFLVLMYRCLKPNAYENWNHLLCTIFMSQENPAMWPLMWELELWYLVEYSYPESLGDTQQPGLIDPGPFQSLNNFSVESPSVHQCCLLIKRNRWAARWWIVDSSGGRYCLNTLIMEFDIAGDVEPLFHFSVFSDKCDKGFLVFHFLKSFFQNGVGIVLRSTYTCTVTRWIN